MSRRRVWYWRVFAVAYVAAVAALVVVTIYVVSSSSTAPAYVCPHDPPQNGDVCWQEAPNGPDQRTDPA